MIWALPCNAGGRPSVKMIHANRAVCPVFLCLFGPADVLADALIFRVPIPLARSPGIDTWISLACENRSLPVACVRSLRCAKRLLPAVQRLHRLCLVHMARPAHRYPFRQRHASGHSLVIGLDTSLLLGQLLGIQIWATRG